MIMKAAELMRFIIFPGCPKSNKNQVKLFKTIKYLAFSRRSSYVVHYPHKNRFSFKFSQAQL